MKLRLAAMAGILDPDQLEISEELFQEWWSFFRLEPWGHHNDWLRHGHLASVILKAFTGKSWKPSELIPDFAPKKAPSEKALASKIELFFADMVARGANIKRVPKKGPATDGD